MAVFGVETEKHTAVASFVDESEKRMESSNIFKNPFTGKIKRLEIWEDKATYVYQMDAVFPPFYLLGGVGFIMAFVLTGFSWWTFPGAVLFSLGIFWSKYFLFAGFFVGLRKYGYKGKIKLLTNAETIRRLIN